MEIEQPKYPQPATVDPVDAESCGFSSAAIVIPGGSFRATCAQNAVRRITSGCRAAGAGAFFPGR